MSPGTRLRVDLRGGVVRDRGVYLNIASPLAPLTVHDWSDARWKEYLDTLRRAGINRLYLYLWQDILSDYAAVPADAARNRRLHERLRRAVRLARRRGLRVFFLLAPTFVPRPIFDARPELRADIDYVRHGFPCICPSRAASWPVMEALFDHEWGWLREADGFQLWFYDPGGCLCAACRKDLCAPLVRQAEVFSRKLWASKPNAIFQASFWPVWAWEAQLGRTYGVELLDRLKALFGSKTPRVEIVDNAEVDVAFLDAAKARGFRTQAFLFSANVETPFVFLHPQRRYLEATVRRVAARGWDGAMVHALFPGAKALNTLLAARMLTTGGERWDRCAREACRLALGPGGERLAPELDGWDRLLCAGGATAEGARAVFDAVVRALEGDRGRGDWRGPILDSARVLPALVAGDAERVRAALSASQAFAGVASQTVAEMPRIARWLKDGWDRERF